MGKRFRVLMIPCELLRRNGEGSPPSQRSGGQSSSRRFGGTILARIESEDWRREREFLSQAQETPTNTGHLG